jgi:hypothetical protein
MKSMEKTDKLEVAFHFLMNGLVIGVVSFAAYEAFKMTEIILKSIK